MFSIENADRKPFQSVYSKEVVSLEEQQRLLKKVSDDPSAFWPLWRCYEPYLYRCCLKWTRNRQDAEDRLSEVMLKAQAVLPSRAAQIRDLRAWLTRLSQNVCRDLYRKRSRESISLEKQKQMAVSSGDGPLLPERALLNNEISQQVRGAIAALPPGMRQVAVLEFLEQNSTAEIAAHLAISPRLVRQRIQRARPLLRQRLSRYLIDNQGRDENAFEAVPRSLTPVPALVPEVALRPFDKLPSTGSGRCSGVQAQESGQRTAGSGAGEALVVPSAVKEIEVQVVTIRAIQVTLPTEAQLCFYFPLRREPSRQEQRRRALQDYVERCPTGWKKRLELAELLVAMGDWESAIEAYRAVLSTRPDKILACLQLGKILHLTGRPNEAIAVYEQGLSAAKQAATRHHLRGLIATCRRQPQTATSQFEAAIDKEPDNAAHWHALGLTQLGAGYPVEAVEAFEQALQLNGDDLVALTYSCEALCLQGNLKAAQERAQKILDLDRENVLALKRLADIRCSQQLVRNGEGRETKRLILRARKLAPHAPDVYESLARYHILRQEKAKALDVLQSFAQEHPKAPAAWYHYAQWLFWTNQRRAAKETMLKAYALHPHDTATCRALYPMPSSNSQRQDIRQRFWPILSG